MKVIHTFTPLPWGNLICSGSSLGKNCEELFTWFTAVINWAGRAIWMSSVAPESLLVLRCVIIMSGKSYELWVCYHREDMTGFLHISGANKEMRMHKKTFLTGKQLKSFFSPSKNFKWEEDLEFANTAPQIYIIFRQEGGLRHDDSAAVKHCQRYHYEPSFEHWQDLHYRFQPCSSRICPCHLRPIFQMVDFFSLCHSAKLTC